MKLTKKQAKETQAEILNTMNNEIKRSIKNIYLSSDWNTLTMNQAYYILEINDINKMTADDIFNYIQELNNIFDNIHSKHLLKLIRLMEIYKAYIEILDI